MTYTTNYNLNIVEGTDVVNPLIQFNPNFTAIDTAMKDNADASIERATCITSGTVHAVTYSNTDAAVFRFTATGDWTTGDTMTVNGTSVSVFLPDGTAPQTGAYVINTEVLAAIQGTRVTLYTAGITGLDAEDVVYDNTVSGLTATDVQAAIDELAATPAGMYALGVVTTDAGCTVTLTKGAKTVNCTEVSSGVYEGAIDEYGTWAVNNVTLGYTRNFTVDTVKVYNLSFIPDGRTITPVNDVQTLLHCAGIFDKGYTVLSQLIADTTSLYAVITDNNAIDYLVRSTSFTSGITGDSTAMNYVGSDNYASDTLLSDATWLNAIAASAYMEAVLNVKVPTMTSNTTPSGVAFTNHAYSATYDAFKAFDNNTSTQWSGSGAGSFPNTLGYDFTTSNKMKVFKIAPGYLNSKTDIGNFIIEGSNDGVTYTQILSDTMPNGVNTLTWFTYKSAATNNYRYIRLSILDNYRGSLSEMGSAYEVQFYGRTDV